MKTGRLILTALLMTLMLTATAFADDVGRKMEGDGFDTPREAMTAYIKGLQDNDIDEMIAAFAVETYALNYDIAGYVERVGAYVSPIGFLPQLSDFSVRLNIENQRKNITDIIRAHYLVLLGSPAVLGDKAGMPIPLKDSYASAQELVDDVFGVSDEAILDSITFENEFYSPALISGNFMSANMMKTCKRQADMINAQGLCPLAARLSCNGKSYLLIMDAVQYGTKWYLSSSMGILASLQGLPTISRGLVPMDELENL